jgi:hypothetical protein
MPLYSPIAPVRLLRELHYKRLLSNYLLLLAHDVNNHPEEYVKLLSDMDDAFGARLFVILDNGVIENGSPVSLDDLLRAANTVQASVVVAPDVIGDLAETKRLVAEQADKIYQRYPIMLIPQGETFDEVYECINWMSHNVKGVNTYWGVPRWMANKFGTRRDIIKAIAAFDSRTRIHLLGMSENQRDDLECALHPQVMGMDSANPLVLGWNGKSMRDGGHMDRKDYWERATLNPQMCANVKWVHDALRG